MCETYSVGYLKHLFKAKEYLGYRLASIHNLRFVANLMAKMRVAIQKKEFSDFRKDFLSNYKSADQVARNKQALLGVPKKS